MVSVSLIATRFVGHGSLAIGLMIAAPILAQASTKSEVPASMPETKVGPSLPGAFFLAPKDHGPHPTIIILGGSEGGDIGARAKAPLFLAEGYAVLGLPYYSPAWRGQAPQFSKLPRAFASIPLENLEIALAWLSAREDVRSDAIGIYGVSKGAEYALLAGSLIDGFAAIAAIVPSDVVWEGWGPGTQSGQKSSFSWRGKDLPFVPYVGMQEAFAKLAGGDRSVRLRVPHDRGRNANPDRAVAARIAVQDIDEPVLVAGGDADRIWNSGKMAQSIAEQRAEVGLQTVSLVYTDAGHALSGTGKSTENRTQAEIEAELEIWPATISFFERYLAK